MRHHFTPTRTVVLKKTRAGEDIEKMELSQVAGGTDNGAYGQPLWKTGWAFLERLNMELSLSPATPLQGALHSRKMKTFSQRILYTNIQTTVIRNIYKG